MPNRALVVIDVQNEYITGNLRIEYPPVQQSLARIGEAMDAAQARDIPIVIVQHSAPSGAPIFARDSDGWVLHPVAADRPHALRLEKQRASCFVGTELQSWLRSQGVDTLTLVGYMAHNCVTATALQAAQEGYSVEVLSDATGSLPYANQAGRRSARDLYEAFLVVLQSSFAKVVDTATWAAALDGAELPKSDSIYGSYRQALDAAPAG